MALGHQLVLLGYKLSRLFTLQIDASNLFAEVQSFQIVFWQSVAHVVGRFHNHYDVLAPIKQ
jgi:hypothetical protein